MPRSSILRRLAGWLAPESRALVGDVGTYGSFASARPLNAANPVTPRTALSVAAVYQAVQCYTWTLGPTKAYIAETDARGGRKPATYHPAYDLIRNRPNGRRSTASRFRMAWIGHALTYGNGYAEILWDSRGRTPVEFALMDPRDVEPYESQGSIWYRQKCGKPDLPAEDVLHLAMFGWDGVRGYSPITVGARTINVAAAQRDYQANLFDNSAGMQGHIEVPGTMRADAKAQMLAEWNKRHQGIESAGMTGILDAGAKWVQTSFSPQDAELILGAKFSVEEIARLYNLPPHKLGILDNASYATVEQANIDFYQTSVFPWLNAIEEEFDLKLFGRIERQNYFVTHDISALLKGDSAAQRAQEVSDLDNGVQSINEIRIGRGLDRIDDPRADFHWVPTNNLSPIELMPTSAPAPDPTPGAPDPVPGPESPPLNTDKSAAALRDVLADPLARMIRRESVDARRAARRGDLDSWMADYYGPHSDAVAAAISPGLRALNAVTGSTHEPDPLALALAAESRRQLRDLVVSVPPDELPGAVDRLVTRWESDRAASIALALVPEPPSGVAADET